MRRLPLALTLALAACASSSAPAPARSAPAAPAATAQLKAPGDARVGDRTRCPVSGEEFAVTASSPHADYKGKTYYFCCSGCDAKFKADPEKYLGTPAGDAKDHSN